MIRHELRSGTIFEGDWLQAPLEPGYTMSELDGPFGMKKAKWDMMGIDGLADWYRPHLERLTGLMAPSSSVYLWNTAEGWARLDPEMRRLGWTFRSLIIWNKGMGALAGRLDTEGCRTWPDVTEICGFYQREGCNISAMARGEVYRELDENRCAIEAARFLTSERERAGLTRRQLSTHFPSKTGGLTGCVTNWEEGFNFPTWEIWSKLHAALNSYPGAPFLQRDLTRVYTIDELRSEYESLRSEYESLRSEYESLRAPFKLPMGVSNNWDSPPLSGAERLKDASGQALHPCQKPLLFAERMVQASTRPGDRVLVPFGGTCRIATYLERLSRVEPENMRYHDTAELNQDGKDYLGAVLGRMAETGAKAGQMSLFGAP
jgi:site-specific DNA-methyltransferase (adenine-specific)